MTVTTKKLVEVADLDTVLGYKGNYMIFALKENNYLTLHMMQDYLDVGDDLVCAIPTSSANYTVEEMQQLAACLLPQGPGALRRASGAEFKKMLIDRLIVAAQGQTSS